METRMQRARALRNTMTEAELHLWKHPRARQIEGFRFRRQVPIDRDIVDFLCPQAKIGVEVDGGQHQLQSSYDVGRTVLLERHGYRVVRYRNHDVLQRVEDVLADIHRQPSRAFTPPHCSPSPAAKERE